MAVLCVIFGMVLFVVLSKAVLTKKSQVALQPKYVVLI